MTGDVSESLGSTAPGSAIHVRPSADRGASRRDALDRWGAAFAHGDDAEVARIVQQSHDTSNATPPLGLIGVRRFPTDRPRPPASAARTRSPETMTTPRSTR
jgi:hypothetical protein